MDQTNGDIMVRSQMDPNMPILQDAGMKEDKACSEATFRFTVPQFSKLKDSIRSPPCYVRNLPWMIRIWPSQLYLPRIRTTQRFLGFNLQCNAESKSSWSCYATAELRLLSVRPEIEDFSKKFQHLFFSKENDFGYSRFMPWNDVLDPEKGYIKDDAITLEVHVNADLPHIRRNKYSGTILMDEKRRLVEVRRFRYWERKAISLTADRQLLERQNNELKAKLTELKKTNRNVEKKLKKLLMQLKNKQKRVHQYEEQVEKMKKRIKYLNRQLDEAEEEIHREKTQKRKYQRECEEMTVIHEDLRATSATGDEAGDDSTDSSCDVNDTIPM